MNKFHQIKSYLMYRWAVIMAEKQHRKDGHRYFVLPNIDKKIFLLVTDRANFRILRRKGYISPTMRMEDVFKKCFYYTNQKDGKGRVMTEEELKARQVAYQMWYADRLKKIKSAK